jgi:hypothetical protein
VKKKETTKHKFESVTETLQASFQEGRDYPKSQVFQVQKPKNTTTKQ